MCRLVRGDPDQPELVLRRDRLAVTSLSRPGVVPGHTLVAAELRLRLTETS